MLPRLAAVKIEARPEIPRSLLYSTPLLAVALTVVAGFFMFLSMGYDPFRALYHSSSRRCSPSTASAS
jgi:general nucleoside transport system permease protein